MIQRPQTLFLLLAASLLVLFLFWLEQWSVVLAPTLTWLAPVVFGLVSASAAAALVSVALFKQRVKQGKVIGAAQWIVLALITGVLVGLFVPGSVGAAVDQRAAYLTSLLPLLAYVMLRLARWGVQKDIAKVRSADRLR